VSKRWLRAQYRAHGPQTHHTQLKAAVALDAVTAEGLHTDPIRVRGLAATLTADLARLKGDLAAHGFLPDQKNPDKALQAIFARVERATPDLHLPRTPGAKYATRKDVLEDLAPHIPFAHLLLEYRATAKLKATFVDKIGGKVVRPSFATLTRSGRTSSFGQINAQNLPRAAGVRECFVPRPGHVFVAADYATVELATLAQACGGQFGWESAMAAAINAGQDLHRLVAATVLGKAPADVTKGERAKAKAINFGKPGGMGDKSLKAYAKLTYGVDLTEAEVKELSEAWFNTFPEMRAFMTDEAEALWRRVVNADLEVQRLPAEKCSA
jgi:DNA polymerase-1